ncbi:hypothetical protein A3750_17345 [Oleiphilus sp. HI0079]|nr:hypothetical protein A3750_17345 [Oleiphilus sp. HI0079]
MMGYTVEDANTPVVKTTNCILAPEVNELPLSEHAQACIRCGLCTEACPAELLPQQLYWFSRSGEYEKAEHHNLFDCIECGACAYVCPSSIPLVQYYRHAKGEIKEQRLETEKSDRARIRFEARQERLEREAQEKEAKRKARADAAAKMQAEKASLATAQNADTPSGKANNTATQDPKKAAIEAALARKQANTEAAPTLATSAEPEKSIDELKELFEKAQLKLDKMIDALEDAKANAPDNVAKLQRAVEKNQLRVNQAKQNYEKARKVAENNQPSASPATSSTALQPSLEELHVHLEKAQNKLEKMEEALKEAKSNTPDAIEKLQRAVTKNKVRVAAAQEAYDHVLKQQQETN